MMHRLPRRERTRRITLARMFLTMQRLLVVGTEDHPGLTLVFLAILHGQYRGAPVTVTAVAAACSLPRSTVIRHLKALEKRGDVVRVRVGNRVYPLIKDHGSDRTWAFFDGLQQAATRATYELSKLDT